MKEQNMSEASRDESRRLDDPDFRNAETALRRAAEKARERAKHFGHGVIIYDNGKIIEEQADSGSGSSS
jgi:hypothetical protein